MARRFLESIVTRFVDALAHKGYLGRAVDGKTTRITATETGRRLHEPVRAAWKNLQMRYAAILGPEEGDALTREIDRAGTLLGIGRAFGAMLGGREEVEKKNAVIFGGKALMLYFFRLFLGPWNP